MKLNTRYLFLLLLLAPLVGRAQQQNQLAKPQTVPQGPPLSLQEAIRIGLENNFGIQLARRDEEIASNNVTRGNAGQLPSVNGNFSRTFNINNTRQQREQQKAVVINGGKANALNANVGVNWTIFDGFGMFIAYDRLRTLENGQRQITRATMEETVESISNAYFAVVRESGKIKSLEQALAIGQQRIDLTQAQVDVGVSAKVEVLTARVDFNADRSLLIQQQEALKTAKVNLNNLLSRGPQLDFSPSDSIVVTRDLDREAINQGIVARNPRLQQARFGVDVAQFDRKLVRASRYPQVDLTGGYGLTRNINNAFLINTAQGSVLGSNTNRVFGPNYGVVASVPIFDGFNRNRLEQNARVAEEQSRIQLDQTRLNLESQAEQAYAQYQNRLQLLELEEDNITLARQNVAIALERYRLGLLTPLELREAQRNRIDAETRLLDIRYQAKEAETVLRRLSGSLVQEGGGQ
ncbi:MULTISPECIES: TolC family protein [Hymenobacter]|uniref:TolC family protein n=1 Tax=Hymenobacter jejuensis TaxID=2502781 RepID=A0A5B7ZVH7_9BACT|nr:MULTISPECIES: TolC family protein [Hymenobacter]MBC6988421.1 TolC family protein [Hymenobacter sp. BT491]QDA59224.1 TolC family protein [Hymenobacter jejuensis]